MKKITLALAAFILLGCSEDNSITYVEEIYNSHNNQVADDTIQQPDKKIDNDTALVKMTRAYVFFDSVSGQKGIRYETTYVDPSQVPAYEIELPRFDSLTFNYVNKDGDTIKHMHYGITYDGTFYPTFKRQYISWNDEGYFNVAEEDDYSLLNNTTRGDLFEPDSGIFYSNAKNEKRYIAEGFRRFDDQDAYKMMSRWIDLFVDSDELVYLDWVSGNRKADGYSSVFLEVLYDGIVNDVVLDTWNDKTRKKVAYLCAYDYE